MTDYKEIREQFQIENQGQKIFGMIQRPDVEGKVPAVLYCHGLAGQKIGKHRMYVLLGERLAKVGIASFRFDFRGSGDSEGDFGSMSLEGEVSDAIKAFEFMAKHPNVDKKNLGLFGRSFGGAIAVIAAHRCGGVKSIALWAPVFNASQWEEKWEVFQTHKMAEEERRALMRINGQMPSVDFYKELFRMKLEKELKSLDDVPMLNIHGIKDPIVSIEHANYYEELRKNSSGKSKFIRLPHSDHDFTHPEEKIQALNVTTKWFQETLG